MFTRIYPVVEVPGAPVDEAVGRVLGKVVEIHPDLEPLLDFYGADALEMAVEVGMVHASEEDGIDDLDDIDFGPVEWHEPAAGIAVLKRAIDSLTSDPGSIARAIYDPALKPDDVVADLKAILAILEDAADREVQFRLVGEGQSGIWPRPPT